MKVKSFYIFLIISIFVGTSIFSQNASNTGSIYGNVQDSSGNVLAAVHVWLESDFVPPMSATTNATGNFRFVNLPPGSFTLTFFRQGFEPRKYNDIVLSIGEQVKINVVLEPALNKAGRISGIVTDNKGVAIEGVNITIQSDTIPSMQGTTTLDGSFQFEGLPAGKYVVILQKKNYLPLKREQIELAEGGNVELNFQLTPKAKLENEISPVVERRSTGISWTYSSDFLRLIPNYQSIYALLDHTPAIDSDTYATIHADLTFFEYATVVARGSDYYSTVWNYDGLNISVPDGHNPAGDYKGDFPTFFNLENLEEVQIVTAANDISIPTAGVTINLVSKRGGREWHGNGSFYYSDDSLQSNNTPQEVLDDPRIDGIPTNRLDRLENYGFDLGGPVLQNKLFIWGSFYQGWLNRFNIGGDFEKNKSTSYNLKLNWNLAPFHQFQFGYFRADHSLDGGVQHKPETILPGIWSGQYYWTPDENTTLIARYGYIGAGALTEFLFQQPSHVINTELNHYLENCLGGNHEFRFGFGYNFYHSVDGESVPGSFSFEDNSNTLTTGTINAFYADLPVTSNISRTSFYSADSYRRGRLALNLGLRFDRQTGVNNTVIYQSPIELYGTPDFLGSGFEKIIPDVIYPGKDPGITFDNLSPRIGVTYDLTGSGNFLAYGSFAKYYQPYDKSILSFSGIGPFSIFGGAPSFSAQYENLNHDSVITTDEIKNPRLFSFKDGLSRQLYDPHITDPYVNEYVVGTQTRLKENWWFSATFTHRSYHDVLIDVPFGLTMDDFFSTGSVVLPSLFGNFVVPTFGTNFVDRADLTRMLRNNRSYVQTYNGLDLTLRTSIAKNFLFSGGLVIQRQNAHGYFDDFPPWFFLPLSHIILGPGANFPVLENHGYYVWAKGLLVTPYSEWQLKCSSAYRFPWNVNLGAFLRYEQGYPFILLSRFLIYLEPIGSRRYDNVFTLDLRVDKEFSFEAYGRISLIFEVFNATNSNPITGRRGSIGELNENLEFTPNPFLNMVGQFLPPRVIRLGLRYSF